MTLHSGGIETENTHKTSRDELFCGHEKLFRGNEMLFRGHEIIFRAHDFFSIIFYFVGTRCYIVGTKTISCAQNKTYEKIKYHGPKPATVAFTGNC